VAVLGEDVGGYVAGGEGEKGIIYHELTAVLWKAVQELTARVAAPSLTGRIFCRTLQPEVQFSAC